MCESSRRESSGRLLGKPESARLAISTVGKEAGAGRCGPRLLDKVDEHGRSSIVRQALHELNIGDGVHFDRNLVGNAAQGCEIWDLVKHSKHM